MLGTILYGPGDVRCEDVPEPSIVEQTDAIIRLSASCICGSDLWPFRGLNEITAPLHMGCSVTVARSPRLQLVKRMPVTTRATPARSGGARDSQSSILNG